ncbi:helix-turn-helix transcriptional regulator [Rufibacter roseolus]|uniref:helix-turn-helix transcriptional regulator n=1 Tax=Rufibacter roseolus TaxID=2817375 RepID=UPI001B3036F7|nr:AraC family transcriptional regulator [Rufibacter roseolus]
MSTLLSATPSRIAIPSFFAQLPDRVAWSAQEATLVEYRRFQDSVQTQVQLDNHLFMVVLHGQKEVHTPQGDLVMPAGTGGVIKKGSYLMSSRRCQDDRYESLLFFLPTSLLQTFAQEQAQALHGSTAEPSQKAGFTFPVNSSLALYLQTLVPFFKDPSLAPAPLLHLKLQELLWQLWLHDTAGPAFRNFLAQLQEVARPSLTELLEKNFLRPVTLEELAFMGGFSLSGFKRACRQTYGMAPGQWLRQRRLEHAHFLLRHTNANVSEVADAVGYESPSHFVQAFRQQYGHTPGKLTAEPSGT